MLFGEAHSTVLRLACCHWACAWFVCATRARCLTMTLQLKFVRYGYSVVARWDRIGRSLRCGRQDAGFECVQCLIWSERLLLGHLQASCLCAAAPVAAGESGSSSAELSLVSVGLGLHWRFRRRPHDGLGCFIAALHHASFRINPLYNIHTRRVKLGLPAGR